MNPAKVISVGFMNLANASRDCRRLAALFAFGVSNILTRIQSTAETEVSNVVSATYAYKGEVNNRMFTDIASLPPVDMHCGRTEVMGTGMSYQHSPLQVAE